MELIWRREGIKSLHVQDERLFGVELSGKTVEIDTATGNTSEPRQVPPLPLDVFITSMDPPTLERVANEKAGGRFSKSVCLI